MGFVSGVKWVARATSHVICGTTRSTAKFVGKKMRFAAAISHNFMPATEDLTQGVVKTATEGVENTAVKAVSKVAAGDAEKTVTAVTQRVMGSEEFALRRTKLVDFFKNQGKLNEESTERILYSVKPENVESFERIAKNAEIEPQRLEYVHQLLTPENEDVVVDLLKDKTVNLSKLAEVDVPKWLNSNNTKLYKSISGVEDVDSGLVREVMQCVSKPEDVDAMYKIVAHDGVKVERDGVTHLTEIFYRTSKYGENIGEVRKLINCVTKHEGLKIDSLEDFSDILKAVNKENRVFAQKVVLNERKINLSTAINMLEGYSAESDRFMNELLEVVPENYRLKIPYGMNYEVATKYIRFIKSLGITSEKDIIALLETIKSITNEQELNAVIKMIRENPARIRQISNRIIIKQTCLKNADEFAEIVKKSGRDLSPAELEEFSMYYGCIKKEESRKVMNRLLADKNIKLEDVSRIQYDLLNSQNKLFSDEKKAKFLNRLLDKGLPWDDVQRLYSAGCSEQKIALIERFIDNPKFLKCNIDALPSNCEAELERLLRNDIFRPENYHEYIKAMNRGEQIGAKASETKWKQLESLLKKYPDNEAGCIQLASVTTPKNKKLVTTMLKREFSLDDVCRAANPYYLSQRSPSCFTEKELEFLSKLFGDKAISKDGLRLILQTEPEKLYKIMQKYPAQVRKALNAGINVEGMETLLRNKNFDFILAQIKDAEKTHGVKIKYPLGEPATYYGNSNDLFLTVRADDGVLLKFDKRSGRLLTISQDKMCLNVRNGVRSSTVSYEGKRMDGTMGDITSPYYMETCLEKPGEVPIRTIYKESSIPGQYDITSVAPDGKQTKIGISKTLPSGKQYIQRTLKSIDGHTTQFKFKGEPGGDRFMSSVTTNPSGKVVSSTKRSFRQLTDTHFISSVNGKSYDIEYLADKVVATKLDEAGKKTAQTVEYAIVDIPENTCKMMLDEFEAETKLIQEQMEHAGIKKLANEKDTVMNIWQKIFARHGISPYSIDRKTLGLMKQLPGDEWFAMKQSCQYVVAGYPKANNACFAGNPIFMSDELINNFGVFSHEMGHAKFQALNLAEDNALMDIYNREKRLFTQMYPEANIKSIDYFLQGNAVAKRGVNEGAGETNLIDQIFQSWGPIQDRTILWEQYFQETAAYIKRRFASLV